MRIVIYHSDPQTANQYIPIAIAKAFNRISVKTVIASHENLLRTVGTSAVNGVLVIGGAGADEYILSRLSQCSIPKILWTTEDPYELERNILISRFFDYTYTNCEGSTSTSGFTYLPLAACHAGNFRVIRPSDDLYNYDFAFIGTAWPNRVAALDELFDHLPRNIKAKVIMPHNQYIQKPNLKSFALLNKSPITIKELSDIWNSTKVVLTLGRIFSNSNKINSISPPPRLYEASCAGCAQVILDQGSFLNTKYESLDLVKRATTIEECAKAINFLLENPEVRIEMAKKSQQYTLANDLYENRLEKIIYKFKDLSEALTTEKPLGEHKCMPKSLNVLHVAHNLKGFQASGGTELYIEEICKNSSKNLNHFVIAPTSQSDISLVRYTKQGIEILENHSLPIIEQHILSSAPHEHIFASVILKYCIEIVHYHHLLGFPLIFPLVSKALGCANVMTIHDYYIACHKWLLINHLGNFCEAHTKKSLTSCQLCLQADGLLGTERNTRLLISRRILSSIDKIICSTRESAVILKSFFSGLEDRVSIVQMLTPGLDDLSRITRVKNYQTSTFQIMPQLSTTFSTLRVIAIGNQARHKGLDSLLRIINNLRGEDFNFRILGADDNCEAAINALGFGAKCNVSKIYDRATLLHELTNSDVALSLSMWPETYNISLGEAMAAGVVPIATNIGAHKDRIRHEYNGFLVNSAAEVIDLLRILRVDKKLFSKIQVNLVEIKEISVLDHTNILSKIYFNLRSLVPDTQALISAKSINSRSYTDFEYQLNDLILDFRGYSSSAMSVETSWDE